MRGRGERKDKLKVYHSTIAKLQNGLRMRFTGATQDSKFADSGGWVFADTEQGEAIFYLENEDIRARIDEIPQNKWVTVRGEGKGEGAWIIVEDEAVLDTPRTAQPQSGPPPMHEGGPEPTESGWEGLVDDVTDLTVRAVHGLNKSSIAVDGSAIQGIWSTLFIAMDKRS